VIDFVFFSLIHSFDLLLYTKLAIGQFSTGLTCV